MQSENIEACKSARWNGAIHEKSVQHENDAVWKKCNMKKYKLLQWNTEKAHKSSEL